MAYKKDINLAKTMGSIIRALRLKKYPGHGGQIKCAADFGVSQSEWSHWERGTKTPSAINQKRIADHFAVNVGVLWGEGPAAPAFPPPPLSGLVSPSSSPYGRSQLLPSGPNSTHADNGSFLLDFYRLVTRVQARILGLVSQAENSPAGLSQAITALTVVDNTLERTAPNRLPPPPPPSPPPPPPSASLVPPPSQSPIHRPSPYSVLPGGKHDVSPPPAIAYPGNYDPLDLNRHEELCQDEEIPLPEESEVEV